MKNLAIKQPFRQKFDQSHQNKRYYLSPFSLTLNQSFSLSNLTMLSSNYFCKVIDPNKEIPGKIQ